MMLRDLLGWWSQQMFDLVPAPLRRRDAAGPNPLIIVASPRETMTVSFFRRHGGDERLLNTVTLDDPGASIVQALVARLRERRAVLRLPADYLLERDVVLPLAAQVAPEMVLRNEMDRLTPFAAQDVYWTWRLLRRDHARGKLHLRLTLVMKSALRPVIEALLRAGVLPVLLETSTPAGPRRMLLSKPGKPRRGFVVTVAVAYCVMGVAAMVVPFVHQMVTRAEVEARIARLQPQVREAEALRRRIAVNGNDVFAQAQAHSGNALEALAAVTDLLPDDTFLTDFALRQGSMVLSGQSSAAARLISLLTANPRIRNPAFNAPVTRNPGEPIELFSIEAGYAFR